MMKYFKDLSCNKKGLLIKLVILFTTFSINECKLSWYQPKEPEGLEDFLRNQKNNK